MNRWCSIRSKESGEEEPVVNQDSSASASISQVAGADDDPIESTESGDVNVEETVVPLEGRGSKALGNISSPPIFLLMNFFFSISKYLP